MRLSLPCVCAVYLIWNFKLIARDFVRGYIYTAAVVYFILKQVHVVMQRPKQTSFCKRKNMRG